MGSAKPIIAQERPSVNSDLRFETRTRVRRSVSLSAVARHVYAELDEMSGPHGECWPKQTTLAAYLGFSRQAIIKALQDLERRGLIRMRRTSTYVVYSMTWRDVTKSDIRPTVMSPKVTSDVNQSDIRSAVSINEPGKEPRREGEDAPAAASPPARSSPRVEELGKGLRTLGYTPDAPLLERLVKFVPPDCPIEVPVSLVRKRITRHRAKPLKQCMLLIFFREDVPQFWRAEAAILERQNAELARASDGDRRRATADRIEAQGILERGETDPIERDWAIAILEMQGAAWAATA